MELTNIVDWEHRAAQWLAVLSAIDSCDIAHSEKSVLWPIYGSIVRNIIEKRPYVLGQSGQSLDGRIATITNQSHYINGRAARVHLHRLRSLVDAVVVGAGTVISDDPQLTVRHTEGRHPARVIIDPNGRVPANAKCFRDDGVRRIVIESGPHSRPRGVECIQMDTDDGELSPRGIIGELSKLGLLRLLIEGGSVTLSRFIAAGCLNRLHVLIAPLIIGSGKIGIRLPAITTLDTALRPIINTFELPGSDVLFDCDLELSNTK
ncbi:MAG TPA: hypothetical protein DGZ24_03395 [Rhodospirillaceae bacterium]|nr:hypothetical protein [Candidatus Neomarinimicrobiota bacterium]HCX14342.1 hypothetical protein [Rhodospirillaceae bacterium]